jgi:uncharacterized membrane protein (GlpM family)
MIKNLIIYFITGGLFTTLIVFFEESNQRYLSGFAALMPIFTLVSYFFIGETKGAAAVSHNGAFVLVGTLVSWVPYMIVVIYLAPKIGTNKAIALGLAAFFTLSAIYLFIVSRYHLFQ